MKKLTQFDVKGEGGGGSNLGNAQRKECFFSGKSSLSFCKCQCIDRLDIGILLKFSLGLEDCSEERERMARRDCFGWLCEIAVRKDGETR